MCIISTCYDEGNGSQRANLHERQTKMATNKKKAQAFAKVLSGGIAKANKALKKLRAKPIYDSKVLNLAIATALEMPKMPADKNAREWCATNGAPIVDIRKVAHENKEGKVSCLRPENFVRQRLATLRKVNSKVAKVAYCRYLVNGTADACDPTNDNAYKVYLYRV